MPRVAVALGSNVGNREAHLEYARSRLQDFLSSLRCSRWYETEPAGVAGQGLFLNGAAVGETALPPRDLLDALLAIERERGRVRPFVNAPRTLDLDLLLYDSEVIEEPGLIVPHPRFRERRFVLEPLAEIAPELVDPVSGATVGALLSRLGA